MSDDNRKTAERAGLVYYRPSNGTEMEMFEAQCGRCRHCIDDGESAYDPKKFTLCTWGILDRLAMSAWTENPQANWFDPADLKDGCPAECLRFTDKNDPSGDLRDPPPKDCIGQMFFNDLDVPIEMPNTKDRVTA